MIKWILGTSVLSLAAVTQGFAGNAIGNGGNAVVCYADETRQQPVSVELFDYWEMSRELRSPRLAMGAVPGVKGKIDFVLDRLATFDVERAQRLRKASMDLLDRLDAVLIDLDLNPIDDDRARINPVQPCFKEQFAVQMKEPFPGQERFLISQRLYRSPLLSDEGRAGIILHEVIYREAILAGQETSDRARYYNFMISSDFLENPAADYAQIIANSGLPLSSFTPIYVPALNRVLRLYTSTVSRDSNGKVESGRLADALHVASPTAEFDVTAAGWLSFHPNGDISALVQFSDGKVKLGGQWTRIENPPFGPTLFYPGLKPKYVIHLDPIEMQVDPALRLTCLATRGNGSPGGWAMFNENDTLQYCNHAPQNLTIHGTPVNGVTELIFDDQGNVRGFFTFSTPIRLPIAGCESTEAVLKYAKLDATERLVEGSLSEPKILQYDGLTLSQTFFKAEDCKLKVNFSGAPVFRHSGKRVIVSGNSNVPETRVEQLCTRQGWDGHASSGNHSTQVATRDEEFFNLSTLRVERIRQGELFRLFYADCEKTVEYDYSRAP